MEANSVALRARGMAEGHKTLLMTKLTESKMVHKEKLTPSQGGWLSPEASFWGSSGGAGGWRSVPRGTEEPLSSLRLKKRELVLTCSTQSSVFEA